jgi:hypothetical protein
MKTHTHTHIHAHTNENSTVRTKVRLITDSAAIAQATSYIIQCNKRYKIHEINKKTNLKSQFT